MTDEPTIGRRHPDAKCEDCSLLAGGEFVPSAGPAKADLAVVGEAPGANEAKVGTPFIGESGQLLNSILKHYQILRKDLRITNACLCRDSSGATPTASNLEACRPRLMKELQESGATKILALGNSAAQTILDTKVGVTSLRLGSGRTNKTELPNATVYPSFHPAACLRVASFFPSLVSDVGKAYRGATKPIWYEPIWRAYDDPDIALQALAELDRLPIAPVVVDIESDIEKDVSFEQPTRHKLLCVGLGYTPGKVVVIGEFALEDNRVRDALRNYLQRRPFYGQNGKFDAKGLWAYFGVMLPVARDSMLLSYVQDERSGIHSLEYQGIELLGAPDWKHVLDKYKKPGRGYGAIVETEEGRQVLYQYNAWDVHVTALLIAFHEKEIEKLPVAEPVKRMADDRVRSLMDVHDFLCIGGYHLGYTEANGIGIDLRYNAKLWKEYQHLLLDLRQEIASTIPGDEWASFNPNSPLQVKKVVKEEFGLRLPMKLNSKKEFAETSDKDALEELAEKVLGTPAEQFFRKMLEHRTEAKQFGTYVKGLRKREYKGRINSVFSLHVTSTGRLSSRNPNLQNITRSAKIKRQFVPVKKDNVFVQGDFGQAELRTLCWLAEDPYLRDVFNDPNRDLFNELTPRLYGDVSELGAVALKELRIRVKAYCVPQDVPILTRRGWLTCDEVKVGDETIGYDLKTHTTQWTSIKAVRKFEAQPLVRIDASLRGKSRIVLTCTPDHRWVADKWRNACKQHGVLPKGHFCDPELIETQRLTSNSRILLSGQFHSDRKRDITDNEAAVLGWLLTDGTIKYYPANHVTHVAIFQRQDSPWASNIEEALKGLPHTRHERQGTMYGWRLKPAYARDLLKRAGLADVLRTGLDKYSPEEFILGMSDSQRRAYLEAFCRAEGEKLDQKFVYQFNKWRQSTLKIAGFLEGYVVRENKNGGRGGKFRLSEPKFRPHGAGTTTISNAGKNATWCVETALGSWTALQDNSAVITGNCYGLAYGREARSIALEFNTPVAEAERGMKAFFEVIPKVVSFRETIRQQVLNGNDLVTPFGRHRRFFLITRSNRKDILNEALAFIPQSTASDITLDAFCHLRPRLKGIGWLRNIVHDSILAECHKDAVPEVRAYMEEEMLAAARRVVGDYVSFKVDMETGPNWGDLAKITV